ncbi:MAG: hypothetical protein ACK2U5_00160, partial [Candidatus Promineifilaceae bacterium]
KDNSDFDFRTGYPDCFRAPFGRYLRGGLGVWKREEASIRTVSNIKSLDFATSRNSQISDKLPGFYTRVLYMGAEGLEPTTSRM